MQRQKQLQYAVVGVLGFALLFMTIGFAAYAQLTSLDAASAIDAIAPVHNISFDATSYQESDTSVSALSKSIKQHSIDLSVKLAEPGDSYAALVNVVNSGTVDEILDSVHLNGLDESLVDIVDYRICHAGFCHGGASMREQMMITVEYREDAENIGPLNLDLTTRLSFKED